MALVQKSMERNVGTITPDNLKKLQCVDPLTLRATQAELPRRLRNAGQQHICDADC